MKTGAIILACVLLTAQLLLAGASRGQGNERKRISLDVKHVSLVTLFKVIETKAGVVIMYEDTRETGRQDVNISVKEMEVATILDSLLKDRSLKWSIRRNVIRIENMPPARMEFNIMMNIPTPSIDVRGKVYTDKSEPAVGVTVAVKGGTKATSTNSEGEFVLTGIDSNAVLVVSGTNIETQEAGVSNRKVINIMVKRKVSSLDEIVVMAYGTTTQRANTGAVTVIKGEQIATLPNRSFDKSLQGLVPGLLITNGTAQPGGNVSNMVLRGISTGVDVGGGLTARNPLIVIDGVPVSQDHFQLTNGISETPVTNPLAQLNPTDIESISVLKDAAAISLYGSKASNGVILVTTKSGKPGRTVIHFNHQTNIAFRATRKMGVLNRQEYLDLLFETYKNTDPVAWTDEAILADLRTKFPVKADGSFYPTPDWDNELLTNTASTLSTNVGISGGNDRNIFYLNAEYTKEQGAIKKTGYERMSFRFNYESRPARWLTLGTNTLLSYNVQDVDLTGGGSPATRVSPLNPVYLENGNYLLIYPFGMTAGVSPNMAALQALNTDRNIAYRGLTKFYATVRLLKDLTFSSTLGADFMLAETRSKNDARFYAANTSAFLPSIEEMANRKASLINSNTLSFNKIFGKNHTFGILVGQESQINTQKFLNAEVRGTELTLPYYDQLNSPGYTINEVTGNNSKQTLLSIFSNASYGFRNKYFLSASTRRDGASKFGNQQQWGLFWSAGAGWVISEEAFVKKNLPWLNFFKVRGSLGAAGNSGAISDLNRFDLLVTRKYAGNLAVLPNALPGNPDIRWERTFNWDLGLEVRLLKERVSFTADLYNKKTSDAIYNINLPSITGFGSVASNIGDIENSGIELSVSGIAIQNKNFQWTISTNWSTNKNILVKANVPLATLSTGYLANEEGRNMNSFYLPVWMGVNPADGKPQWLGADGKPTDNYSTAKREFVGKPQPDGFGTVTNTLGYKNISFSCMLYYQYGLDNYNDALATYLNDGRYIYVNQVKEAMNYWKKPGDIAANPRRYMNNTDRASTYSTRFLFSSSYIRLSNVSIRYNFSKAFLAPLRLSSLSIFLQGTNLALWTSYPGPDPDNTDVGGSTDPLTYPNQQSFSGGISLSL